MKGNHHKVSFITKARITLGLITALTIGSLLDLKLPFFTSSIPKPESHARRLLQAEDEALLAAKSPDNKPSASRLLQAADSSVAPDLRGYRATPGKPIMSTFFEPVSGGCCGMTEEGHRNLVMAWRRAWELYGWETRVLKEEDAKKHPRFDELTKKLEESGVNGYNQRCFWRWLAMSLNDDLNGGWMSD